MISIETTIKKSTEIPELCELISRAGNCYSNIFCIYKNILNSFLTYLLIYFTLW